MGLPAERQESELGPASGLDFVAVDLDFHLELEFLVYVLAMVLKPGGVEDLEE